ncbi:ribose-5-phosphate isomerase RpiA [Candidatus Uabimicrobium amorphum]|uniref:Ribose-5-phosphate isomerase A n=1 Tax=Uabimicrobium amorphum TaxID=2596890 RepID=A0A5S9IK22_UABAM|nr:ribose-5-phosphate isomerase RpiA [Candidatus Uabimicrobium amorphum]BBM83144.1 ribose-5-phosphate isomerase A [Candidatus Uabimicrobium amorphum]
MDNITREKTLAATAAVSRIKPNMIVGLGSGSTAEIAVQLLGEKVKNGMQITGVPSSVTTKKLAQTFDIPLITDAVPAKIDITIDGADEFDENLNLIKGGGGALLHEKIVASASRELIIIVDSRKTARPLGSSFHLPVEVIPYAHVIVEQTLCQLGSTPKLRRNNDKPFVTDEGNYILDCNFNTIANPQKLASDISQIPGVVEHGMFIGMATRIIIGSGETTRELQAT